jgi:PmbA protein
MNILSFARQVLNTATSKIPGSEIEVYCSCSKSLSVRQSNGKLEDVQRHSSSGFSLRVIKNGKTGISYRHSLDEKDIPSTVGVAAENLGCLSPDECRALPSRLCKPVEIDGLYDSELLKTPDSEKIRMVREMEKLAKSFDGRITSVLEADYSESSFERAIVNSHGLAHKNNGTVVSIGLSAIAQDDGQVEIGADMSSKRCWKDMDFDAVANTASRQAVSLLGAKRIKSGVTTLVLHPIVGCEFLEVVAAGLCADMVQKGKSLFSGKIGAEVASSFLNIIDDGTIPYGIGSAPFDDEGNPTMHTPLVIEGVLKGYLYDTYTANRDHATSTGNCVRSSLESLPNVGTSNLFIEPGNLNHNELISTVTSGLFVQDVMGMHTVDASSGDFSVGVRGFWIENGRTKFPVHGVTIAGNIINLLKNISAVGNNLTFYGSTGSPTLKVDNITVSGK